MRIRRNIYRARWSFAIALAAFAFCGVSSAQAAEQIKQPKYVFLFIGDGISFPQRSAAELYKANVDSSPNIQDQILRAQNKIPKDTGITNYSPGIKRLVMNTFPAQGISTTYSANSMITDSSSSGTAIATGQKTRDGVVGMDADMKVKFTSMAKIAKAKGKKVGIVTSVSIDHATPAAFYACQPSRNSYYEISVQAPAAEFDYYAGGGFKQPKGVKGDQKDIFELMAESGYKITRDRSGFDSLGRSDGKVLAINPLLDSDSALPYTVDRGQGDISLADFVKKGIELLDNDHGFFMMTEGGKVDWACHANDAISAILDVLSFDEAVAVAYDFYNEHPEETLIVVTGDHETGGMTIGFAGTRYDTFFDRIARQRGSYDAFTKIIRDLRDSHPDLTLEVVLPAIKDFFGLEIVSAGEIDRLQKAVADGDQEAIARLAYVLQPFEVDMLSKGLANTLIPANERPRHEDGYYKDFGSYEPLTVALTHILNNKAGIGWTTFSHTGLPTPVSAVGVGQEMFMGHYDNTDIFKKIVAIAY